MRTRSFPSLLLLASLSVVACSGPSSSTDPVESTVADPLREAAAALDCGEGSVETVDREVRCVRVDGTPHGPFTVLGARSRPLLQGNYVDGERSGAFISFWPNGTVQQRGTYSTSPESGDVDDEVVEVALPDGTPWIVRTKEGARFVSSAVKDRMVPEDGVSADSIAPAPTPPNEPDKPRIASSTSTAAPTVIKPDGVLTQSAVTDAQTLLDQADRDGAIRVIVQVRAPFKPEGELAPAGVMSQRTTIRQKQQGRIARVLSAPGREITAEYETIPYIGMVMDSGGLAELLVDPEVTAIEPDRLSKPVLADSTDVIGAQDLWDLGYTGDGWTVAVLDTGTNKNHSFLSGKVVDEACYSTNGYGAVSLCPNDQTSMTGDGAAAECESHIDGCGHGTHVSGIAAGSGTTSHGVARGASIFPIQVFSRFDSVSNCGDDPNRTPCVRSYSSDQIKALERVYSRRSDLSIASVNMSLGGGDNTSHCDAANSSLKAAIDNLRSAGIATVIASGNDGFDGAISSPACVSTAVSVGSSTKYDSVSSFSNHSNLVTVLAPGSSIRSAVMGGGFESWNGTSMATPHVAGAFALLRQVNPTASVTDIVDALTSTGVAISREGVSVPRIALDEAIAAFANEAPTFNPPGGTFNDQITVTLSTGTAGATIHYTTDGTAPSHQNGIEVSSGDTVTLTSTTTLRAVAVKDGAPDSPETSVTYSQLASLSVNIEPAEAVIDGAQWRLSGPLAVTFDDDLWTNLTFQTSEDEWFLEPGYGVNGSPAMGSAVIPDNGSTTLRLTFESSGGNVRFQRRVSSEANYDILSFFIDEEKVGQWSGVLPWTEVIFPIDPGTRQLDWVYSKDLSVTEGLDAAWIDDIVLPGDQWRDNGDTVTALPEGEYEIVFPELPGWRSPDVGAVQLSPGAEPNVLSAVYTPVSNLQVHLEPHLAREAGARWRVDGGSWLESGEEVVVQSGSRTIEFFTVDPWLAPEPMTVEVTQGEPLTEWVSFHQAQVATPELTPNGGTFPTVTTVSMSTATPQATIHFTLDGSPPTPSSAAYLEPIDLELNQTRHLRARAFRNGWLDSQEASAVFFMTGTVAAPTLSPTPGTYTTAQLIHLSSSTPGTTIRYTVDGTEPTETSSTYEQPIPLDTNTTLHVRAKAWVEGWIASEETAGVFTGTGYLPMPKLAPAPGTHVEAVDLVLLSDDEVATLRYTLDGTIPTETSPAYDGPISLENDTLTTVFVRAFRDGWEPSAPAGGVYRVTGTVSDPEISPGEEFIEEGTAIFLSTSTPGAVLRYTLDGSDVTEDSTLYSTPIVLPVGRTHVQARAFRDGWTPSNTTEARFTVQGKSDTGPGKNGAQEPEGCTSAGSPSAAALVLLVLAGLRRSAGVGALWGRSSTRM